MRIRILVLGLIIGGTASILMAQGRGRMSVSSSLTGQKLLGDGSSGPMVLGASPMSFRYQLNPTVFLESEFGVNKLVAHRVNRDLNTNMVSLGMKAGYRFLAGQVVNPLLYVGGGLFNFQTADWSRFWDVYGAVGAGFEVFVNDHIGLNLSGDYRYTTGDDFDGGNNGPWNDGFLNLGVGLAFHFGERMSFGSVPVFSADVSDDAVREPDQGGFVQTAAAVNPVVENVPVEMGVDSARLDELLAAIKQRDERILLLKGKLSVTNERLSELEQRVKGHDNGTTASAAKAASENYLKRRFQIALSLYGSKDYQGAVNQLRALLQEKPGENLTACCWYWLGENFFALQDYAASKEAYQHVLGKPNSRMSELATIMISVCHFEMGNVTRARADFQKFLQRYPGSDLKNVTNYYLAEISS